MPSVHQEVRWLLLNFPAKALCDAEALSILFGGELPRDVGFQLKVSCWSYIAILMLIDLVSLVLDTGKSCHCHYLFLASV